MLFHIIILFINIIKKDIYDKLQSMNSVGKINIKCNIISEYEYKTQDFYYKNLNYKNSLNGIMLQEMDLIYMIILINGWYFMN